LSAPVISVENISKAYRLGVAAAQESFREKLAGLLREPLRRLRAGGEDWSREEDTHWALRDVSFQVNRGDCVALVGRNGAGKSTMLKILSRITEPTEGCVRLRGRVASLLEVGTGFHPELTGRENIFLNGAILGMKREEIRRKFDQIVEFSEIGRFLDTPVKRYSSGMYVRLAFAVAAHLDPEVLIVDEVLAVGDAQFQAKCLGKMQDVAGSEGRTVLFVSHNMGAVRRLCKTAVYLQGGRVAMVGPTDQIVDAYLEATTTGSDLPPIDQRVRDSGLTPVLCGFRIEPGGTSQRVETGGTVVMEVTYDSPVSIPNAAINIMIDADRSERVIGFNTRLVHGPVTLAPGRRTVRCTVEDFPIVPGHYTCDLLIWSNNRLYDHVERAAVIDVKYANYFGTGELPNPGQGHVVKRHRWEL
jgi:lipopolysaccharide transport system ATP-binding protein